MKNLNIVIMCCLYGTKWDKIVCTLKINDCHNVITQAVLVLLRKKAIRYPDFFCPVPGPADTVLYFVWFSLKKITPDLKKKKKTATAGPRTKP